MNADIDYHAVPPPENQAGGDSKREDLCHQDSRIVTMMTTGSSSSGQLEAAGASSSLGDWLLLKISQTGERTVHLEPNIDGKKYMLGFILADQEPRGL